ncbi:MAG: CapA family protein [Anaerolineaceae bacterium]
MGGAWFDRHDPWFGAFVLSAIAVGSSLFALATAVVRVTDRTESTAPVVASSETPIASATFSANVSLSYAGPLPSRLVSTRLKPVETGKKADVTFAPGGEDALVTRIFIPVSAMGSGVDNLTADQADSLLRGTTTDWAVLGGVAGKVVRAAVVNVDDPAAQALQALWMGTVGETLVFASYAELRRAMTLGSGMVALVPLSEVRFGQPAIAIDGVDPVRGRGDTTAWPYAERISITANSNKARDVLAELRAAALEALPKVTRVVATGDILQSRCSLTRIRATGDWAAALRGPVGEYLAAADLALGSLDGSIQDVGTPNGCIETTNLTSPPEVMAALTLAGIDEVTVATNHVFDCGQSYCGDNAFLRTLDLLAEAGIKVVGGGRNLEEALMPAIFEVNGTKFGILGFDDIAAEDLQATETAPGTAPLDDSYADEKASSPSEPAFFQSAAKLDLTRFEARIKQLKSQVDVVIVQIQSGTEDTHRPSERSTKAIRAAAVAGADLVVGNQAHWVQAIELTEGSFMAYALGNFVFDQTHTQEHTQGYLLEASFWGKQLAAVRFLPYQIEDKYRPTFVTGATRAKILGDVFRASVELPLVP